MAESIVIKNNCENNPLKKGEFFRFFINFALKRAHMEKRTLYSNKDRHLKFFHKVNCIMMRVQSSNRHRLLLTVL